MGRATLYQYAKFVGFMYEETSSHNEHTETRWYRYYKERLFCWIHG